MMKTIFHIPKRWTAHHVTQVSIELKKATWTSVLSVQMVTLEVVKCLRIHVPHVRQELMQLICLTIQVSHPFLKVSTHTARHSGGKTVTPQMAG